MTQHIEGYDVEGGVTIGPFGAKVTSAGELKTNTSVTVSEPNPPTEIPTFSGTTDATPNTVATVTFCTAPDKTVGVYIENDSYTLNTNGEIVPDISAETGLPKLLAVSLDGGATYRNFAPGDGSFFEIACVSIKVKSLASASVSYGGWYALAP